MKNEKIIANGYKVPDSTNNDNESLMDKMQLLQKNVNNLLAKLKTNSQNLCDKPETTDLEKLILLDANYKAIISENEIKNNKQDKLKKSVVERKLVDRQYIERNSMLTDMREVKHIRAIYNIFITFTIFLVSYTICYNLSEHGELNFHFHKLANKFKKLDIALMIWFPSLALTLLVQPFFKFWAKLYEPTSTNKILNSIFISIYINYFLFVGYTTTNQLVVYNLPFVTSMALLMEIIRLLMKSYAFIRTNASCVVGNTDRQCEPTFLKYLYFMFAPTLIYRDSYPRNKQINWVNVAQYLTEFLAIVYSCSLVFDHFLEGYFIDFGKTEMKFITLLTILFKITSTIAVIYLYGFYTLQHAWMNMCAELLRFGDRLFYRDWWNSNSLNEYYRTWNTTIHDWLYEYIFKDFYFLSNKSSVVASLMTVTVSAIVHEYALAFSLRFFLPILFIMFNVIGCTLMIFRPHPRFANIFIWWSNIIGNSMCYCLYRMEYYTRVNVPVDPANQTLSYYFIPQSFQMLT